VCNDPAVTPYLCADCARRGYSVAVAGAA
jgi:hypothetical protein